MSESTRNGKSISEVFADPAMITAAITRGARRAVLENARAGRSVATWKDGKVVLIPPAEILARFANEFAEDGHAGTNGKPFAS